MGDHLRLIERMRTMPCVYEKYPPSWPLAVDRGQLIGRCRAESNIAAKSEIFLADDIAAMYYANPKDTWVMVPDGGETSDFPNAAPPFSSFVIEWPRPENVNFGDSVQTQLPGQDAVVCVALELAKSSLRNHSDIVHNLLTISSGGIRGTVPDVMLARYKAAVGKCRWMLVLSYWFTVFSAPICGMPAWSGLVATVFVGDDGAVVDWFQGGPAFTRTDTNRNAINSPIHIALLTLSFLHCKNVIAEDVKDVTPQKWLRRKQLPSLRYRTLNIKALRETLHRDGDVEHNGLKKALHICRGHFAKYTEESPLFGHYIGTVWRPQHTRGDRKYGEVVKDYRIKATP